MTLGHPAIGMEWVVVTFLMVLIILLKRKGYTPASGYGMALGAIVCWLSNILFSSTEPLKFEPEQFMYVLLPPIVLNSGLKFDWSEAKGTLGTSLVLAWFGTIGTAAWISVGLWAAGVEPWIVAFWIGSILSPTDPVGTLDQMTSLGNAPIRLVLEHESLLNDAVAIMLVHTSSRAWEMSTTMTKTESMEILSVAIGMAVLSLLIGMFSAWVVGTNATPTIAIVVGMFTFSLCESIGASGIIALFVFGASLRIFTKSVEYERIKSTVGNIAELSETYVYVSIGGLVSHVDWSYTILGLHAVVACVVGRMINVYLWGYLIRICGVKWTAEHLLFTSSCGMRGAVSLALAVSVPDTLKPMILTITLVEVVASMILTSCATAIFVPILFDD
jgi:NhaP-type Na+/H+ or K+/H+ antiporter